MWKTPFRPVPSTTFFPQALCIFFHFSTAPFSRPVDFRFSTGCLSTFHRACGIFSGCERPGIFTGKFLKMPCLPLRGRWPSVSEVGGSAPGSLGHSPSHGQARASPLSEGAKAPPNSIRRNSEALPSPPGGAFSLSRQPLRRFLSLGQFRLAGEACLAPTFQKRYCPPFLTDWN